MRRGVQPLGRSKHPAGRNNRPLCRRAHPLTHRNDPAAARNAAAALEMNAERPAGRPGGRGKRRRGRKYADGAAELLNATAEIKTFPRRVVSQFGGSRPPGAIRTLTHRARRSTVEEKIPTEMDPHPPALRVGVLAVCAGPGPWGVEGWEDGPKCSRQIPTRPATNRMSRGNGSGSFGRGAYEITNLSIEQL